MNCFTSTHRAASNGHVGGVQWADPIWPRRTSDYSYVPLSSALTQTIRERSIILVVATVGLVALAGCTSTPETREKTHQSQLISDCSELEGYPDCRDGHRIEQPGIRQAASDSDARITANVRRLLDQYPPLESPNSVRVQTRNHVVYLTGLVDTNLERRTATSVALQAEGVARIVNSIAVNN